MKRIGRIGGINKARKVLNERGDLPYYNTQVNEYCESRRETTSIVNLDRLNDEYLRYMVEDFDHKVFHLIAIVIIGLVFNFALLVSFTANGFFSKGLFAALLLIVSLIIAAMYALEHCRYMGKQVCKAKKR